MNKVFLNGRLGKDPEEQVFQSGKKCAKFSLATSESVKVNGQYENKATWHNITLFGAKADWVLRDLRKGDLITVEGQICVDEYEKDGQRKQYHYIKSFSVFYEKKREEGASGYQQTSAPSNANQGYNAPPPMEDDIPF